SSQFDKGMIKIVPCSTTGNRSRDIFNCYPGIFQNIISNIIFSCFFCCSSLQVNRGMKEKNIFIKNINLSEIAIPPQITGLT
ncbi:hypothetical protein ACTELE_30710, partial [Klebsiella michiganensis]|uniref:hypothetical protein n=1 Tax=Klebsiella michiganensis TaxID=1134687 RepID=UPI003EEFA3F3